LESLTAQNIWFSDNFSKNLGDKWVEISGKFRINDGKLILESVDKPALLGLNLPIPSGSRYTIKIGFSGENVLILFNFREIYSMRTGNYVKFFKGAVYTGVVELNGEERVLKFVAPRLTPSKSELNNLSIEVTPERYIVYLNDRKVLEEKLYFDSGYIAIGVSVGKVEIDYFLLSSNRKYTTIEDLKKVKEPVLDQLNSIAVIDDSKFVLSSDVYSQVQIVDTAGKLINRFSYLRWVGGVAYFDGKLYIGDLGKIISIYSGRSSNVAEFMVKYPGYIYADADGFYIIDDGVIKIFNQNFRLKSSFSDPDNLKFPTAIATDKHNIYCTDPVLGHIVVYLKRETKLIDKIKDKLISPIDIKFDTTMNSLFVADIGLKAIVKVTNGKVEKIFKGEKFGGLKFPRSIDLRSGMIFIADADKILSVDTTLSEDKARLILRRKSYPFPQD
jgi:hypothetical protein